MADLTCQGHWNTFGWTSTELVRVQQSAYAQDSPHTDCNFILLCMAT